MLVWQSVVESKFKFTCNTPVLIIHQLFNVQVKDIIDQEWIKKERFSYLNSQTGFLDVYCILINMKIIGIPGNYWIITIMLIYLLDNISGESSRFAPFKQLHNRRLLWHGSRATNYAGILSQGLRIAPPEAPIVSSNWLYKTCKYLTFS